MKKLLGLFALFISMPVLAHTPVCSCQVNANKVQCEGGFHDGSTATETKMNVIAYSGEPLINGELNKASRFSFELPTQPFYIVMDVGPGEMFELDWQDILNMKKNHFSQSETNKLVTLDTSKLD